MATDFWGDEIPDAVYDRMMDARDEYSHIERKERDLAETFPPEAEWTVIMVHRDGGDNVASYTTHTEAPDRDAAVLCARRLAAKHFGFGPTDPYLYPLERVECFLVLSGHHVPDVFDRNGG